MQTFITVEEARETILERIVPLGYERVAITELAGRRLAETVLAPENSPPFDNSAMDGYAVRYADLSAGASLTVVGEIAAGNPTDRVLAEGEAMKIMTGAPMPEGADTVVIREDTTRDGEEVIIDAVPVEKANVRHAGSSLARGEIALDLGQAMHPGDVALLASFRRSAVSVYRRPRVAILTTGDELQDLDETPRPGAIINSNAYQLRALCEAHGAEPIVFPTVPDDPAETRRAFNAASKAADLVVSAGGVSVGDFDYVREILDELAEGGMKFWKIRMKPGKPLAFGTSNDGVPLLGLPGNPVSAFVCFFQFVRPVLLAMQGAPADELLLSRIPATVKTKFKSTPKRRHYVTGNLQFTADGAVFEPYRDQSSGNLKAVSGIRALGVCEEGVASMKEGDPIDVEWLP